MCFNTLVISPYQQFDRQRWCQYRDNAPLTLTQQDVERLQGVNDFVSLTEVEEIYLPLARLLSLYVTASQSLHRVSNNFLHQPAPKVPYLIGVAGSVAVGKSTTSRILQALLSRSPEHPRVALVTTDGFLYPLAELQRSGLMNRKGFPESYDLKSLVQFLMAIKSGEGPVYAPVYSHHRYDIVPDEMICVDHPDIVIVEGLNILQTGADTEVGVFVSDFFDFTLFVDAKTSLIKEWFIQRLLHFRETSFQAANSYFHAIAKMTTQEAVQLAERVWRDVNELNLKENILPYKNRADLILEKGENHLVSQVFLRKL